MNRIAFLDRDGVLNVDIGYAYRPEDCKLVDGAAEATRILEDDGWLLVVVTNQSGVARGYYSEQDIARFHACLNKKLSEAGGAKIAQFYHCPHHPDAGNGPYTGPCNCRKPKPGMLLDGLNAFKADPANCLMIGDKDSDMEAARAAGITGHHFSGGRLDTFVRAILESE